MSVVNITDIGVLNNPGRFTDPYVFKITFECISELTEGKVRLYCSIVVMSCDD